MMKLKLINIATVILLLLLPYYIFEGKMYLGGDDTRLFYLYPFDYLKNVIFYTWINISSVGVNASNQNMLPFLLIWSAISSIIPSKVILNYLAFSLPLVLGFIYFNKVVIELFNWKKSHKLEVYLGSLFFVLSPIIIFDQMFIFLTTIWLLGIIPAVAYYFIRYLKTSNFIFIYISMIIFTIFAFVSLSVPWILGFIIPLLFGLCVLAILSTKKEILIFIKRTIVFVTFILLSQTFWLLGFIVPYIVQDKNSYAFKFLSKGYLDSFEQIVRPAATGNIIYPLLNLFHRQIALDFKWKLFQEFINYYDKTFPLNLIFVVILIFGALSYKKYLIRFERKIYISIMTSFLISLYFFTVNIGALKNLFFLLGKLPGFVMFRNFDDKFAPGYVLFYSTLISVSLVVIKGKYPKIYKWIVFLTVIIIFINFIPVKSTVNSPLWQTENINRSLVIPREYLIFMDLIKKNISPTNNILSLPFGTASYTIIKEENSNNSYVGTSPVKIFSGVNDISGNFSFNFSKASKDINDAIIYRQFDRLNNFFYIYNINYVMITNNVPTQIFKSYVFYEPTLKQQNKSFLESITNKKILSSQYGNYVLYSTKRKNTLLSSKNLYFKKINSVKYILYLKNIKKPQELLFNDTFHGDWRLYLQQEPNLSFCSSFITVLNSTTECKSSFDFFNLDEMLYPWNKSLFTSSHAVANGFSNKWEINPGYVRNNFSKDYYTVNKDGSINIELVLYFQQQLYFYYGTVISSIVFVLSSGYLIIKLFKKSE